MIIISFEEYIYTRNIQKRLSKQSNSLKALEGVSTSKIASNNTNKIIVSQGFGGDTYSKKQRDNILL